MDYSIYHATFTVPRVHEEAACKILENLTYDSLGTSYFENFCQISLQDLTSAYLLVADEFAEQGIPYSCTVDDGDYEHHVEHVRFTSAGVALEQEIYPENQTIELSEVFLAIESGDLLDLDQLRERVRESFAAVLPLPWTNQLEYGKRHCMNRLIEERGASG